MRCHRRHVHPNENRCGRRCHDAVIRRGGNAHSQYNAAKHRQKQRHDQPLSCQSHNGIDQVVGKPCHRDATGDDPRHTAGCSHRDGALSSGFQRIENLRGRDAVFFIQKTHANRQENGQRRRLLHRHIVAGDPDNQRNQRNEQVCFPNQLRKFRQLFFRDSGKPEFFCLQMHRDEDPAKI